MRSTSTILLIVIVSIFSFLSSSKSASLSSLAKPIHQEEVKEALEGKCLHCHGGGRALQQDLSQPECQECHGVPTLPSEPVLIEMSEPQVMIKQEVIHIPAGTYVMGSPGRPAAEGRGNADEGPPHEVQVDGFYIDLYETTNAHFQAYLEDTGVKPPLLWRGGVFPGAITNHPVVYVSWHDADAYCAWAGKRLPTEKEWEKAARGDDRRNFPWGVQFDTKKANTPQYWLAQGIEVYKGSTMPVASFESGKSPYGLYDMAGNVYEWVSDWYMPYPGNQVPNVHYGKRNKVLRGGSWYDCMSYGCGLSAPVYNRSRFTPEIKNKGFGFRCASDTLDPVKKHQNQGQEQIS